MAALGSISSPGMRTGKRQTGVTEAAYAFARNHSCLLRASRHQIFVIPNMRFELLHPTFAPNAF